MAASLKANLNVLWQNQGNKSNIRTARYARTVVEPDGVTAEYVVLFEGEGDKAQTLYLNVANGTVMVC